MRVTVERLTPPTRASTKVLIIISRHQLRPATLRALGWERARYQGYPLLKDPDNARDEQSARDEGGGEVLFEGHRDYQKRFNYLSQYFGY
jgi:hypothetical protein